MSLWKSIYQGSVKDIYSNNQKLLFKFSDRYSVFDWGAMPDQLERKGETLALLTDFFFRHLNQKHHGIGLCNEKGELSTEIDRYYKVHEVEVHRPAFENGKYNYSKYKEKVTNCLVPLEFVFRFGIPKGSSFLDRVNAENFRQELGLEREYEEGEFFPTPIIEFSTKLESTDRYLSLEEAREYSGMSSSEFSRLIQLTKNNATNLKEIFEKINVTLWDGKFEYSFAPELNEEKEREFVLVDSIGPDELRLSYQEMMLSKEFLRQFYRSHPWYLHIQESKKIAKERNIEDWKSICIKDFKSVPPQLDPEYKKTAEMIYLTLTNELYKTFENRTIFEEADDFEALNKRYESLK